MYIHDSSFSKASIYSSNNVVSSLISSLRPMSLYFPRLQRNFPTSIPYLSKLPTIQVYRRMKSFKASVKY